MHTLGGDSRAGRHDRPLLFPHATAQLHARFPEGQQVLGGSYCGVTRQADTGDLQHLQAVPSLDAFRLHGSPRGQTADTATAYVEVGPVSRRRRIRHGLPCRRPLHPSFRMCAPFARRPSGTGHQTTVWPVRRLAQSDVTPTTGPISDATVVVPGVPCLGAGSVLVYTTVDWHSLLQWACSPAHWSCQRRYTCRQKSLRPSFCHAFVTERTSEYNQCHTNPVVAPRRLRAIPPSTGITGGREAARCR